MKNNKGLTLLELLLALSIIGVLAISAGAWMHSLITLQRLDGAATRIYGDLRLAQSEALKRNKTVFVSFNAGVTEWCYGLSQDAGCDCSKANSCLIDGVEQVVNHKEFRGIELQKARFAGGTAFTAFEPNNGFAQAGSVKNGTVWLKSAADDQLAVIVNRLGRVRFCSPTIEKYSSQCPDAPAL